MTKILLALAVSCCASVAFAQEDLNWKGPYLGYTFSNGYKNSLNFAHLGYTYQYGDMVLSAEVAHQINEDAVTYSRTDFVARVGLSFDAGGYGKFQPYLSFGTGDLSMTYLSVPYETSSVIYGVGVEMLLPASISFGFGYNQMEFDLPNEDDTSTDQTQLRVSFRF